MDAEITKVFLTNEFQPDQSIDFDNSNTDVIVQLKSGEKYIASFLTYQNLESIRQQNLKTGSFINGKYFWIKNMLIIDNCSEKNIRLVINHLLDQGEFKEVFRKF